MKMHSYMSTNGYLQSVDTQAQEALIELHRLTGDESIGGYEAAVTAAHENRRQLDELTARRSSSASISDDDLSSTPNGFSDGHAGTPIVPEGSTASYIDPRTAVALRQRLNLSSASSQKQDGSESDGSVGGSVTTVDSGIGLGFTSSLSSSPPQTTPSARPSLDTSNISSPASSNPESQTPSPTTPTFSSKGRKPSPHPLVDHPDGRISALAKEYTEMELELVGSGPEYVRWPENISLKNFAVYQLIPTLVYELEYPRTDRCVCLLLVLFALHSPFDLTFNMTLSASDHCTFSKRP